MRLNNGFDISSSALTAQRLRMDVIASNISNADTTRGKIVDGKWEPYQRKMVVIEPNKQKSFSEVFQSKLNNEAPAEGVKVTQIIEDQAPFKKVYNPTHPDSDENGFVLMPNVDVMKEMVD